MIISAALRQNYTPENLYNDFPDITRYYNKGSGYADSLLKDGKILDAINSKYGINLKFEDNYYYGKAWGGTGNLEEGNLVEALKDGKVAIWSTKDERFTKTGHYMAVSLREDGKLCITDPNGLNWDDPYLKERFKNGFTPEEIARGGGCFYIFSNDSTRTVTTTTIKKDDDTITNEILQKALEEAKGSSTNVDKKGSSTNVDKKSSPTNVDKKSSPTNVIKPKWESDYLTAPKGYIKYEGEDGRLTKETRCDLNPKQLGINMNNRRN